MKNDVVQYKSLFFYRESLELCVSLKVHDPSKSQFKFGDKSRGAFVEKRGKKQTDSSGNVIDHRSAPLVEHFLENSDVPLNSAFIL